MFNFNLQFTINIPCLKEQQKIADFLTTFDKRITAQQNIIADMEETKKGLLQKLFSQEIRFKDDNGEDYPKWEKTYLSDMADFLQGLTYKPEDVSNTGVIVFRSSNIKNNAIDYSDLVKVNISISDKLKLLPNDILMCVRNGSSKLVGKTAIIQEKDTYNCTWGAFMNVIRSKEDNLFVYYFLQSNLFTKHIQKDVSTTTVNQITKNMLNTCMLLKPSLEEQNKIASFLSAHDKKIEAEKKILADLQEMKKGLLQQMFV